MSEKVAEEIVTSKIIRKEHSEIIYRVKRLFRYNGTIYRRGDEFVPQGLRNDKLIIEHMCRVEPVSRAETAKGSENASKRKPAS